MLAEGVHVVGPGYLTVPHVNLSIGIKEQEKGKEKDKVDIIGSLDVANGACLCLTDVTVKDSRRDGLWASGAGTKVVLQNVKVENNNSGVRLDEGAQLVATECHFHQNGGHGVVVVGSTTTARLTNCTSHHNKLSGVWASSGAVVDLMGEQTSVHDNGWNGLLARYGGSTINVYQPCVLNDMSHGNKNQNISMTFGGTVLQKDKKKHRSLKK